MVMNRRLRKFALTAHVACSVGWLGAVACFLVLAIAGLASEDELMVRAAYLAMGVIAWFVIIPLNLAALLTGLVMSLGTGWGLRRHYWVLVKLGLTVFAALALLVHTRPIGLMADIAAERTLSAADRGLQVQLAAASGIAMLVLLLATILAIYKPRGMTRYALRKRHEQRQASKP